MSERGASYDRHWTFAVAVLFDRDSTFHKIWRDRDICRNTIMVREPDPNWTSAVFSSTRRRSGCAITSLSSCLSWANSHSAHGCSYRRRDGGLVFCYGLTTDRWADIRATTFDGEHGRRWEWKRRVRMNDFSKNLRWCVFSQCPKMSCKCHSGHRGY